MPATRVSVAREPQRGHCTGAISAVDATFILELGKIDIALALADADSRKHLPPPGGKFPTGALTTFSFDGTWKDLRPNGAHVTSFIQPKKSRLRNGKRIPSLPGVASD